MSVPQRQPAPFSLDDLFANPPAAFRGKPFWAWNGELDRDELMRQERIFRDMGMGGFFMRARTGLKTEYLGSEWCDLVNDCADEAEKLGLEAWICDEDRWPSGSAGGLATREERFRAKVLRLRVCDAKNIHWPTQENFAAAFAVRLEGLVFSEVTAVEYGTQPPQDGRQVLVFETEQWTEQSFYNGGTYLDTLSREATDHFLALTHQRYLERCHGRLGRSIRGIFTTEPHRGMVMCENADNRALEEPDWTTPWTDILWEEFLSVWGYDLREHLPELFLFPEGRRVSQVKYHYMELIQRMFLENWVRPVSEWCSTRGLQLTGHVLHEDSLVAQAVPCGSVMRAYEFFDVPGVDVVGVDNRAYWIVKQAASAARQLGKKTVLSELYGCTGWQLDFADHKRIGAWQAMLGITARSHHLAWFTMEGEAKRDCPGSIGFQSAWHREYRVVEDFFARLHVLLSQGERVCDVLVINPVESMWAQIHPGWARWLEAADPELRKLEQTYRDVFTWLTAAQIDFDYADEEQFSRIASLQATPDGPRVQVGAAQYRAVIVAGAVTIRSTTLTVLEDFVVKGGNVIFAGDVPPFVDAKPSDRPAVLASQSTLIPLTARQILGAVVDPASPLQIEADDRGRANLLCQVRRDGERWIVALLNLSATEAIGEMILLLTASGDVEEWCCEDGTRTSVTADSSDGGLRWRTNLAPGQLRVFMASPPPSPRVVPQQHFEAASAVPLGAELSYELGEPNLCVLDYAECQLSRGAWEPSREILDLDTGLRARFGWGPRSETMMQPWAVRKTYGETMRVQRISLRFRFSCSAIPEHPIDLLMESPEIFRVQLNGTEVRVPQHTQWHIDPSLRRVPLPSSALQLGANEIILQCPFTEETHLEAIYLLGSFGVTIDESGCWLTEFPRKLAIGDACAQGLPFYSGRITYRIPVPPLPAKFGAARLELGSFGGAVASVRTPLGSKHRTIAWPPHTADVTDLIKGQRELLLDIVLTRRNTFGPLHLLPREQPFIVPMSFRSDGAAFAGGYVLYPSGLLEEPRIVFSRLDE